MASRGFATRAIQVGSPHDPITGAVMPPVCPNPQSLFFLSYKSDTLSFSVIFFLFPAWPRYACCSETPAYRFIIL